MCWFKDGKKIEEVGLFDATEALSVGKIKLPFYQRDAVWSEERICALWDSLFRGFPLPSFLVARGSGHSREFHQSQHGISTTATEADIYYDVLDGQQRLIAINAAFTNDERRLWIDLAPTQENHPFKYKFWVNVCTKIFPFGFKVQAAGEHEFSTLTDTQLDEIWGQLQIEKNGDFKGKEFYELPLDSTFPFDAHCPVPLDSLVGLARQKQSCSEDQLCGSIREVVQKHSNAGKILKKQFKEPDEEMIRLVASGLKKLIDYRLSFQLIEFMKEDDEDDYLLYERIGRGGVQITPRQLAVSNIMHSLGKEGNDAVASGLDSNFGRK
jgi:hypothetical protein